MIFFNSIFFTQRNSPFQSRLTVLWSQAILNGGGGGEVLLNVLRCQLTY